MILEGLDLFYVSTFSSVHKLLVQAYILTIVNTDFRSLFLSLSLRSLLFTLFGNTQEAEILLPLLFFLNYFFLLFTASVQPRKPEPTLDPGVLQDVPKKSSILL